ncbi:MAG TPA: hypothetical protein PKC18_00615 [Lacipirellulaceae bacterium]|nr:hypothetical protein [Lacipirellulaceae bacterium]HMP06516.1 hypothetical protein [Lacipirellulaceae bacterium]
MTWSTPRAAGQAQLLVAFDFEGEVGSFFAADKSGFGEQLDALLAADASIVNDPQRGAVLQTGSAGLGATTLWGDKLEVTQSWTLSAWLKTTSGGAFEHLVGRAGVGPRIMNHWGLAGVSFTQMEDNTIGFPAPDFGDEVVNFGPGGPPGGDGEWHHMLVTWNHETREFWGYYDGETGPSADNGRMTSRQTVVTHEGPPGLPFQIGGNPNVGGERLRNSLIDDVAFWRGYATQEVAQGLFDGTYTIYDAPIVFPGGPSLIADVNGDGVVDGADFLIIQRTDMDQLLPAWIQEYGMSSATASFAAVPEPASLLLILAGLASLRSARAACRFRLCAR